MQNKKRTEDDFYRESKRLRMEVLQMADALAKDIPSYLKKGEYLGWRYVQEGKHEESAYFAYFDRDLGVRTILTMRKMKNGGPYKPYAIIDQYTFENNIGELQKGTPL